MQDTKATPRQNVKAEKFETNFETVKYGISVSFFKSGNPFRSTEKEQSSLTSTTYKIFEIGNPENTLLVIGISIGEKQSTSQNRDALYCNITSKNRRENDTPIKTFVDPEDRTAKGQLFREVFDAVSRKHESPDTTLVKFIDMYISSGIRLMDKIEAGHLSQEIERLQKFQNIKDELQNMRLDKEVNFAWKDILR